MNAPTRADRVEGITLRQAALIAGLMYLLDPVSYAEFTLYPKLVVPFHIDQTVANVMAHSGTFGAIIGCYLLNFLEDIVMAWAIYILLAPVNRALSLLAALFQLVYTSVALAGMMDLATAYRLLTTPEYLSVLGSGQLHGQVEVLLHTFRYYWSLSLVPFGIHLCIVGALIFRSRYIPWFIGIVLVINGLGWIVDSLQPYLYPKVNTDALFVTFFGEIIFMLWLLIFGWRLKEPQPAKALP